jgi:hypothetical protein
MRNLLTGNIIKFFRSRMFIAIFLIWILLSLGFSFGLSVEHSAQFGNIHDVYISDSPIYKGNTTQVFTQIFNKYGCGIPNLYVNYTLCIFDGNGFKFQKYGYGGITNSSGYLDYNFTGVSDNQAYRFVESTKYNNKNYVNTQIYLPFISGSVNESCYDLKSDIFVTPVVDYQDHSDYAFHIWRIPSNTTDQISVYYKVFASNSELGYAFTQGLPSPSNQSSINLINNVSLKFSSNINTNFPVYGNVYYYFINFIGKSGNSEAECAFSTQYNSNSNSAYFSQLMISLFSVCLGVVTLFIIAFINEYESNQKSIFGRVFPSFKDNKTNKSNFSIALENRIYSSVISLPFIAIILVFTYTISYLKFGVSMNSFELITYFFSMLLVATIFGSIYTIFFNNKFLKSLKKSTSENKKERSFSRFFDFLVIVPPYMSIFTSLTFYGGLTVRIISLLYFLDPVYYSYSVSVFFTNNLLSFSEFSIHKSNYFINGITVILMGLIWFLLIIILPLIFYKKKDNSSV